MTQDVGSKPFADRLFAALIAIQPAAIEASGRIGENYALGKKHRAGLAIASEIPPWNPFNWMRRLKLNARIKQLTGRRYTLKPSIERDVVDSFADITLRQIAQKADDRAQLVAFERFVFRTGNFLAASDLTISPSRRELLDPIKDFALLRQIETLASTAPEEQNAGNWKALALRLEMHASDIGRKDLRLCLTNHALTTAHNLQGSGYTREAQQLVRNVSVGLLFPDDERSAVEAEHAIDQDFDRGRIEARRIEGHDFF